MKPRPPAPIIPEIVLTPEQEAKRVEIAEKLAAANAAQREWGASIRDCPHICVRGSQTKPTWDKYTEQWEVNCGAWCAICHQRMGWYCLSSPKHYCEYDPTDIAADDCIYCHQPDERK